MFRCCNILRLSRCYYTLEDVQVLLHSRIVQVLLHSRIVQVLLHS